MLKIICKLFILILFFNNCSGSIVVGKYKNAKPGFWDSYHFKQNGAIGLTNGNQIILKGDSRYSAVFGCQENNIFGVWSLSNDSLILIVDSIVDKSNTLLIKKSDTLFYTIIGENKFIGYFQILSDSAKVESSLADYYEIEQD